jgi:hypothetical protein
LRLETGANLVGYLLAKGQYNRQHESDTQNVEKFTLSEGLVSDGDLSIAGKFFSKPLTNPIAVNADGKLHFIERDASLSDGLWLVDIEGAISIRELTILPVKLHVAAEKFPLNAD